MKREARSATLVALSCAALWSCASDRSIRDGSELPPAPDPVAEAPPAQATPVESASTAVANAAAIPVATDPGVTSVWDYLASRYDADRNGAVTTAEYTRNEAQFGRWDRNQDGVLEAADFERESRGGEGRGGGQDMKTGRARRTLARYFQEDDDANILTLAEAADAFDLYDGSDGTADDGRLTEGEFTCAMEERHREVPGDASPMVRMGMGNAKPWATLLAVIDGDEDGALTVDELSVFFEDTLETDTIDYTGWGASRMRMPQAGSNANDGLAAQQGDLAPDFTLASTDGDTTYTLSSFRGDRPVAMIFGSYT